MRLGASSAKDRTAEFLAIAERLQRQSLATTSTASENSTATVAKPSNKQQSEFARRAADITAQISKTAEQCRELGRLVKRTSAFNDPTQQISELTAVVKQNIATLNGRISDLQQLSAANSTNAVTGQTSSHVHSVVDNLRGKLKATTADFKHALEDRKKTLEAHQQRRQKFLTTPDNSFSLPSTSQATPSFLETGNEQTQALLQQDNYLSTRAEALSQVESTIAELAGMFNQIAVMVQEQGEVAIRIDENVDQTVAHVDKAQTQLLKYLNAISGNRMLILKVFAVLLVFLVIFIFIA